MTDGIDATLLTLWLPSPQTTYVVQERALRFFVRHSHLCVYLPSTWRNCTRPDLPDLPPPYAYCKRSNTGGGNGLGTGYCKCMTTTGLSMWWKSQ